MTVSRGTSFEELHCKQEQRKGMLAGERRVKRGDLFVCLNGGNDLFYLKEKDIVC